MSEYSQDYWRGLLVIDQRIKPANLDSGNSTYTEAGATAGVPEPQSTSAIVLEATGDQSSTGQLRARVSRPGHPALASLRLIHQEQGDSNWHGWNEPGYFTHYEGPASVSATYDLARPHILSLASGKLLMVYGDPTTGSMDIRSRVRAVAGTWGSEVSVASSDGVDGASWTGTTDGGQCLVQMPSGRVLCFWAGHDDAAAEWYVGMSFSDDDGDSWTVGSPACLPAAYDSSTSGKYPKRLRAAYQNGQIVLVVTHNDGTNFNMVQFASSDGGASFSEIEDTDDARSGSVVALPEGGFVVGYLDGSHNFVLYLISGAYQPAISDGKSLGEATTNIGRTGNNSWADICVTDAGSMLVVGTGTLADNDLWGAWNPQPAALDSAWVTMGLLADNADLIEGALTWHRGRAVLAHQCADNANVAHFALVGYLGGFSTVEYPRAGSLITPSNGWQSAGQLQATPATLWSPADLPTGMGWTGNGTGTEALTAGASLNITTTTNQRYYSLNGNNGLVNGQLFEGAVTRTAGTAAVVLKITNSGATEGYEIKFTHDGTTVDVEDTQAAASVGSASAAGASIRVLIAIASGKVSAWQAVYSTNPATAHPVEWTAICTNQTLADNSGTASNVVQFGTEAANANHDVTWYNVSYAEGTNTATGKQIATGQTNPDDLWGTPVSTYWTYLDDGVSVRAKGGPGYPGQSWNIDAAHRYAIEHLHPLTSPSPSREWRNNDATSPVVAWDIDADSTDSYPLSPLLGVYLDGLTSHSVTLTTTQAAGNVATTFDLRRRVKWTRKGESVRLEYATTSGVEMNIKPDELVGWALQFGTGGTGDVRRINRNTGGLLRSSGTLVKPVAYLDGIDGGEGTTGDGLLWPTRAVLIKPMDDAGSEWPGGIRLTFDVTSPAPPEAEARCSVAAVGWVVPFAKDPDENRARQFSANVDRHDLPSGALETRKRGKVRQRVDLTFSQEDLAPWFSSTVDDHVFGSSSDDQPAAHRHQGAAWIEGLFDHLDGDNTPIVLLQRIDDSRTDAAPGDAYVLNDAGGAIYGRVVGGLQIRTQLGDEYSDELVSFGITVEEEV